MKLLHTSDWHVGKTMRGHSRADEHREVFAEMISAVEEHEVDVVLVAGDLFETAAPSPEAEEIVYSTLLGFANAGAKVSVISGNHDNAQRLHALVPLFKMSDVHLVTEPLAPDQGGVTVLKSQTGEQVRIASLPFVSQRRIVKAADFLDRAAYEHAQMYAERLQLLVARLCEGFDTSMPNVLMAHAFVRGGQVGGGERMAHLVEEYALPSVALPVTASYVALGHLHRPQALSAGSVTHYCGSPLQLDFGEQDQQKQVNIVEVEAGVPARVTPVGLKGGRPLKTIAGSTDEVIALAEDAGDCWLRIEIETEATAGIADQVRSEIGDNVVEVRLKTGASKRTPRPSRSGRPPQELFSEYLAGRGVADDRLHEAFAEHLEAALSGDVS